MQRVFALVWQFVVCICEAYLFTSWRIPRQDANTSNNSTDNKAIPTLGDTLPYSCETVGLLTPQDYAKKKISSHIETSCGVCYLA